jgi:PPIC-type PPIASE domain/SurA N-terminal domain
MTVLPKFSVFVVAVSLAVTAFGQLQSSHAPVMKPVSAPTSDAPSNKPAARVNGVAISEADYDAECKRLFPYFEMHGNKLPKEYEADIRKKALNSLIDTELAYQEAKRRNLQITPLEWQKRIAELRKDYGSRTAADAAILRMFGSQGAFEARLRHDMLLDKIFLLEVKRKATVTDAEIAQYYAKNKAQFVQPESISFQTISAMYPKNPTPEDKKAARQRIEKWLSLAKSAKGYEAFGVLAEKYSEDEFRVMMGDRKMVHREAIAPCFAFAFSMKEGQVSDIVESTAGFHIVRLSKHQATKHFNLTELRSSIRELLQEQRLKARNQQFHQQLRKTAKIEILQG